MTSLRPLSLVFGILILAGCGGGKAASYSTATDPATPSIVKFTTIPADAATIFVGDSVVFRAVAFMSDGTQDIVDATWTSSTSSVGSVNSGIVTGLAAGQTVIDAAYSGFSYDVSVTVNPPLVPTPATPVQTTLILTSSSAAFGAGEVAFGQQATLPATTMRLGDLITIDATWLDQFGKPISWTQDAIWEYAGDAILTDFVNCPLTTTEATLSCTLHAVEAGSSQVTFVARNGIGGDDAVVYIPVSVN